LRGWGCREGCRLGVLKCGGEGGGEGEWGSGDGGAVGEGDEVDDVLGALKLWGADGALAVLGACGGEAVCHGDAECGVTEAASASTSMLQRIRCVERAPAKLFAISERMYADIE
jgi:hypothetical protein